MRPQPNPIVLCLLCGVMFASLNRGSAWAEDVKPAKLELPTEKEATAALADLLELKHLRTKLTVKTGTCIPALKAEHCKQVACTVAVKVGAATSEMQADFYRKGATWVAQPSVLQEKLPFPDPAL